MATKTTDEATPMMRQFNELKAKYADAIILFRCGDFYETYSHDALVASRVLGITLTHRSNKGKVGQIEMAGFPFHALDSYLPRLVRAGYRVAICDQLEDPKKTKTLVKRGVTELVTPGVVLSDHSLEARSNNFLAAVHFGASSVGLSFLDISTGEFFVAEGDAASADKLLADFQPKEILVERGSRQRLEGLIGTQTFIYELDDWAFTPQTAREKLNHHFGVRSLKGFGVDHMHDALPAAGAILSYLEMTQHTLTSHITRLQRFDEARYVRIDRFTARNLELIRPLNPDGISLRETIDQTLTPMGARLLQRWILFPLRQPELINQRLDSVEAFFRHTDYYDLCAQLLVRIGDLERLTQKVAVQRINPREMQQLRIALEATSQLADAATRLDEPTLGELGRGLDGCAELVERIRREIVPDPPALLGKNGSTIAQGVNAELDHLRSISSGGRQELLRIQERETERTGIQSLKIGFNNVFGYYIEVRNTYKDRVPAEWIRKQTLVSAERYITPELKDYEEQILGADDRIASLEAELFHSLTTYAQSFIALLQRNANRLAELDCYYGLSTVARNNRYVRPHVDDSLQLRIVAGRHPVIEQHMAPGEEYVPNDVELDHEKQQIVIVTGPNMSGKSALLRQTALITLMAQMGSFVPAEQAQVGVVDKIFTRVGASDNLAQGESTFMVEMQEAANIMNNATDRSLVLFDELGRGTSTYDGISIAWAIVEQLHNGAGSQARTLFATHYHELSELEDLLPRVKNWNVSVRESQGRVVFLRKLERGASAHSFGIHVARMAGMPQPIVERADRLLQHFEARHHDVDNLPQTDGPASADATTQLSFFQLDDPVLSQIRREIARLDINALTPLEALNKLSEIQRLTGGKDDDA